ncbi:MAG TPA: IS3 family transposase [Kofleriaceae bacterium]|nr:IS3 family transposase [Kofleriaceae bacterium]
MKFGFIRAEKASFPIAAMCRLFGVTRQGYYAFARRPPSRRVRADMELCANARRIFDESRATYGSPRVLRELRKQGVCASKRRVERALRGMGLTPPVPRRRCTTTVRDLSHPVAPNLLARDFDAQRPNERWVTDITYVQTDAGWAYVAVILDLFSRAVVGWAVDTTLTTKLPLAALDAAIRRRRPGAGLLHHSDRGCQYTSDQYRLALQSHDITVSMSRKGNCWDNAVAESFFSTLKGELIHRRAWRDVYDVRQAVFEYIEVFYNRRRLHSSLGYRSPAAFEEEFEAAA